MKLRNIFRKECGGENKFESIKVQTNPHGEAIFTMRTNIQEIANPNERLEQYGYIFGKWIIKKGNVYFLIGLLKALKEGF